LPNNAPKASDTPEALMHSLSIVEPSDPEDQPLALQALNEPVSPLHDSFLAAARRSAQAAAAQAEAERASRGLGGFAWNTRAEPAKRRPPRYALIGLVALAAVLLILGVRFSYRLASPAPGRTGLLSQFADNGAFSRVKPTARTSAAPTSVRSRFRSSASVPVRGSNAGSASLARAPGAQRALTGPQTPGRLVAPVVQGVAIGVTPSARQAKGEARPAPAPQGQSVAALDRLTALANLGNAKAETIVGLRYLDGEGIPPNDGEAAKWLARAAEHGEAVAQYRLGTLYEHGRGVPADPAKAIHWYQAAAQAGNRKAMHNLAVAYAQGTGVSKDFFEAARWFSKAAALGLADSQFNLAVLYERGLGVPQSLIDAYKWYAIAAAQGDAESKARIDAIATQLKADERVAAQRSADQFRPTQLNAPANVPPQLNDIAG
jgi:localization factor PodJL